MSFDPIIRLPSEQELVDHLLSLYGEYGAASLRERNLYGRTRVVTRMRLLVLDRLLGDRTVSFDEMVSNPAIVSNNFEFLQLGKAFEFVGAHAKYGNTWPRTEGGRPNK